LKKLLKKIYKYNQEYFQTESREINYIDIDCINLDNIRCTTEKTILSERRIDVFIEIKSEKWIIAIENKINSEESPKQTKHYSEELDKKQKYKDYNKICLYLTPEGREPKSNNFLSVSYTLIRDTLDEISEELNNINNKKKIFIEQFKDSIELYVMENKELEELCRKLYVQYGDVFEFLFEKFEDFDLGSFQDIPEKLEKRLKDKLRDDWFFKHGSNWVTSFKKSWLDIQKNNNWYDYEGDYFELCRFEFQIKDNSIRILIFGKKSDISPIRADFRRKMKKELKNYENLPHFNKLRFDQESTWLHVNAVEDIREIGYQEAIDVAIKKMKNIIDPYVKVVDKVIKELAKGK
jgi:hypothetical protein